MIDIKEFGCIGDGVTLETEFFQKALDECSEMGETLYISKGKYLIGTVVIKSNTTIELSPRAEILGSQDLNDYIGDIHGCIEQPEFSKCLIYAKDAENITIQGRGTINGRGSRDVFLGKDNDNITDRPMLMRFVSCKDIIVDSINMKDAASWGCHFINCDDIKIDKINMNNRTNNNNDGFDFDGCNNILISNSFISSGDDSICLKSTTERFCQNIVVSGCVISSDTAAFKTGTSSKTGFRNIIVTDCIFKDCKKGAIKLILVDGGKMENININNLIMDNVEGPLFIRLGGRGYDFEVPRGMNFGKPLDEDCKRPVGEIDGICVSNIRASVNTLEKDRSGIFISGVKSKYIKNVALKDIQIKFSTEGTEEDKLIIVPEDEKMYPEQHFFGAIPVYGAYIRYADVEMENVKLLCNALEKRDGIVIIK